MNTDKPEEKSYRQLERIVKGFANHRRIEMMELLSREPELSLSEVTGKLKINLKTGAEHLRRLALAGLVLKRSAGPNVRHRLTRQAESVLKFLRKLE